TASSIFLLNPDIIYINHLTFFLSSCTVPRDLHSFPTRRSSDLHYAVVPGAREARHRGPVPPRRLRADPEAARRLRFRPLYHPHRSEEHTSELQSRFDIVCRLLLEKKNRTKTRG